MTKPGYKTTELWLTVIANVLIQADALHVPDKWKGVASVLTVVGYALSRGLAKLGGNKTG